MPQALLSAALAYARKGSRIFPCEKKIPLIASGFKAASNDELQVREWWTIHPSAQIGLPTGCVNHLFVLDIDGPDGAAAAARLNLPPTYEIETRPGRRQLWFTQADGITTKCTASALAHQLDTRGDGGYVIAPPSIHHQTGRPYRVAKDLPLADLPSCLIEIIRDRRNCRNSATVEQIPQGKRHNTLLSVAGALRACGFSGQMVLNQLQVINQRQCRPPLEDSEIGRLADFVSQKTVGANARIQPETTAEVELQSFADCSVEPLIWLWQQRVPLGKLALFVGNPGEGKSLITIDLASRVSRGDQFPDGACAPIGDVVFLSAEDDPNDTQLPRLLAAGADLSRVHRVKSVKVTLADGTVGASLFDLGRDLEKLDEALGKITATRLLIVDPLSAYMGKVDTHRDSEIRRTLAPLTEIAAKRKIAVVAVMHLKKSETSALLRVSGSVGFVASARVVLGFGENPADKSSRVMVCIKNNLASLGDGLAYRIEPAEGVPRITWLPGPVSVVADDVLRNDLRERHQRGECRVDAEQWLLRFLADRREMPVTEIMEEAKQAQISWRTLERVKNGCDVRAAKRGQKWYWTLP